MLDMRSELEGALTGTVWDIEGVLHAGGAVTRIPAESRVVTEILQSLVLEKIDSWAGRTGCELAVNESSGRGYPDADLWLDGRLLAIEVKSARVIKGDRISTMTLGTYNGYFLEPDSKKLCRGTRCYNDYAEHWIIAVVYEWRPHEASSNMVDIKDICVGQKWQFAGRLSGSGDTANIGGITSLKRLQSHEPEFTDNEDFEGYWRSYSKRHPRRGRMRRQ